MRTKAIIAGAVGLAVLVFIAFHFFAPRRSRPDITVRHVKSVVSANITTMSFEIKNDTADPYIFYPFEVRVRTSNDWTRFQKFDITQIHPTPKLAPKGVASYTVDVTNLPAGSAVRFAIHAQKILLGVQGFARRAELDLKRTGGAGSGLSLNPNDKRSEVYGEPKEVVTEQWVERPGRAL